MDVNKDGPKDYEYKSNVGNNDNNINVYNGQVRTRY